MAQNSKLVQAVVGAALAAMALGYPAHASTVLSFETPVANGGYEYNSSSPFPGPNGTFSSVTAEGVTFAGMSGIQSNGSAWGFTNAPDGTQTAFLQSYSGFPASPGSISFSFTGLTNQIYDLIFEVEGRPSTGGNAFTVNVNGTPTNFSTPSATSWTTEIVPFTALLGINNFTISIDIPQNVTDLSIGVDAIGISSTPLPSTWLMLLGGFVGLGFFAYRGTQTRSAALAAA